MSDYKVTFRTIRTEEKTVTVPDDWTEKQVIEEFEKEYYETEVTSIRKVG